MKRIIVPVSLALAQLFVVSAFAQGKGEADSAQAKAAPAAKATAEEKAAGKQMRKSEGAKQAKVGSQIKDDKDVAGKAKVSTKEQRKEAAKARKASAKSAMKSGEMPRGSGEK